MIDQNQDYIIICIYYFWPRLNTGSKTGSFGYVFSQANPNTVYGSIVQNNIDNDSSYDYAESIHKTITLPRQAFFHFQHTVSDNAEAVCKVRYYFKKVIIMANYFFILIYCNTHLA